MVERIISGGQSGVDRAALDAALELGIPCGGWCPGGRRAEDGPIPARYPLRETPDGDYRVRTEWNVRDADATLVLVRGPLRGGTALTVELARTAGRRVYVADPGGGAQEVAAVRRWLHEGPVRILNVAGPRASSDPGIYTQARRFLEAVLAPESSKE